VSSSGVSQEGTASVAVWSDVRGSTPHNGEEQADSDPDKAPAGVLAKGQKDTEREREREREREQEYFNNASKSDVMDTTIMAEKEEEEGILTMMKKR